MANLQIRLEETLKNQAHVVAADMGMDVPTAVRIFLTQMVRENRLPFQPTGDPFYSAKNQAALVKAIAELDAGQTITKTIEELEGME